MEGTGQGRGGTLPCFLCRRMRYDTDAILLASVLVISTLPSLVGKRREHRRADQRLLISTHSSRAGKRPMRLRAFNSSGRFQPTLPARGRDAWRGSTRLRVCRFQPTLPARGRDALPRGPSGRRTHFNPLFPRGEETSGFRSRIHDHHNFNPLFPRREETSLKPLWSKEGKFQPTLPAQGRDPQYGKPVHCRPYFNPLFPRREETITRPPLFL